MRDVKEVVIDRDIILVNICIGGSRSKQNELTVDN